MNRSRVNFARAFTLIELVLVLAIIAVIASIAVPALSQFERGQRTGDTAANIVVLARWARAESIARSVSYRLNFSPQDGHYWLTVQNGPSYENIFQVSDNGLSSNNASVQVTQFAAVGETIGGQFATPTGVTFSCNIPQQPDGTYIEFRPTGRCDPGTITVTDAGGHAVEVGTVTATEEYHVLSDDEKQMERSLPQPPPGGAAR